MKFVVVTFGTEGGARTLGTAHAPGVLAATTMLLPSHDIKIMRARMTREVDGTQQQKSMCMKAGDRAQCWRVNAACRNDRGSAGQPCARRGGLARNRNAFVAMPAPICTGATVGSLTAGR